MKAEHFELKKLSEGNSIRYLLLGDNNATFVINELLFDILILYQKGSDSKEMLELIHSKHSEKYINESFIDKAINTALAKISIEQSQQSKAESIKLKFTIIKTGRCNTLYRYLSLLFNKFLLIPLLLITIYFSVHFFLINNVSSINALYQKSTNYLSITNLLVVYIIMLVVILFHELGHASATTSFNIKPKEIGFGLYFIFPVFFTNVTDIWQLNKVKRNVVNFAGIYFQGIANIFFIILYTNHIFEPITFLLIMTNTGSIITSLNPFFRFDGYWVVSDTCNLPNLKFKAQKFILNLFLDRKKNLGLYLRNHTWSLILYSLCNIAFWSFIYYSIILFLQKSFLELARPFNQVFWKEDKVAMGHTLFIIIIVLILCYILILHFFQFFRIITNESTTIPSRTRKVSKSNS